MHIRPIVRTAERARVRRTPHTGPADGWQQDFPILPGMLRPAIRCPCQNTQERRSMTPTFQGGERHHADNGTVGFARCAHRGGRTSRRAPAGGKPVRRIGPLRPAGSHHGRRFRRAAKPVRPAGARRSARRCWSNTRPLSAGTSTARSFTPTRFSRRTSCLHRRADPRLACRDSARYGATGPTDQTSMKGSQK